MERIKIEPNGVNLQYLNILGESLSLLTRQLRQCYSDNEARDIGLFIGIANVNSALSHFDMPGIEIDFGFLAQAKQKREQ
jgi:hypothetical protein